MSGFDLRKIACVFPRKITTTTGYAFCTTGIESPVTPKHIRRMTSSGLFPRGWVADTRALCDATVFQDTSEIESLFSLELIQSKSTPANPICPQCLNAARVVLDHQKV